MSKYQELVKSFDNIRKISQDFFIYGYNGRGDFSFVSDRAYDNELRRIKSYLKNYVKTTQTKDKKTISISSNTIHDCINPLFPLFYGKTFTSKDCFLHFVLIDILLDYKCKSLNDIYEQLIQNYNPYDMDIMTVRNKLHEYVDLGIIEISKYKNKNLYCLQNNITLSSDIIEAIIFFQNIIPCGYILSNIVNNRKSSYYYRQVFFSNTLDDEYLLILLNAIENKQSIEIKQRGKKNDFIKRGIPLGIYQNMITGRRYVKIVHKDSYSLIRIDKIETINNLNYDININDNNEILKKLNITITVPNSEMYIVDRIYREINADNIIKYDNNTYELIFESNNLYDYIPYIRTYFGRIINIECEDKYIIKKIKRDLIDTLNIYNNGENYVS